LPSKKKEGKIRKEKSANIRKKKFCTQRRGAIFFRGTNHLRSEDEDIRAFVKKLERDIEGKGGVLRMTK